MNKNRIIQLVAVMLMTACLVASQLLIPKINQQRVDLQIVETQKINGTVPPDVALLSAVLGPFRGLAVDVLWYRANAQKEAGKYYEANQLAQWITKLQPKFAQVWAFHAWNMAYNISVATFTPDERWDWVNKGITLLRDQGIVNNPKSVKLYKELSWIFFHKVGQFSDDMHWYYKRRLAMEWQEIVGTPNDGATTEQAIAEIRKIADAPSTIDEINEQFPATVKLMGEIKALGYTHFNTALLRKIASYQIVRKTLGSVATPEIMSRLLEGYDAKLDALVSDPKNLDALVPFQNYLRKRTIIDDYHMDPAYMAEIMETFGPLDWRHPSSHGLYWSNRGTLMAGDLINKKDIDLLNTYRQHVHSIQDLMRFGRLVFDPLSEHIDLLPDPRFVPMYERALIKAKEALLRQPNVNREQVENSYDAGFENFMQQAITFSYLYGDTKQADEYFAKVRKLYGMRPEALRTGRYNKSIREFVVDQLVESGDLMANARQFIDAMILQGLQQGLANGRADIFASFMDVAKEVYDRFQKKSSVGTATAVQDRMKLLPFDEILINTFLSYLQLPGAPITTRSRVWNNSPPELRQRVYDRLMTQVKPKLIAEKLDPDRVFPEPPGMAEYRKTHVKTAGPAPAGNPDVATVERK